MEFAIQRALSLELGGAAVLYCVWHWSRCINAHISPRNDYHYLTLKILSSRYKTMFRMVHSLINLPLHDQLVRVAAYALIKKEMEMAKDPSKMWGDVKRWWTYLRTEYLSDSASRPYMFWAPLTCELGRAYNTTSTCESINAMIKKKCDKSGTFNNQIRGLHEVVKQYTRNRRAAELNGDLTKRKNRRRIFKSVLLCALWDYTKTLVLYHEDKEVIDYGRGQLRDIMLTISKADLIIDKIMANSDKINSLVQLHLNSRPSDAKPLEHYVTWSVTLLWTYINLV